MKTPTQAGSVEYWLREFLTSTDPERKLDPGAPPESWEDTPQEPVPGAPGRPAGWTVVDRAPPSIKRTALGNREARCRLFHTFLHHELQAAELMAWAILRFSDTPRAFRKGLLAILLEELRHLRLYRSYLRAHGVGFGDLPIRDWFWSRVPRVDSPAGFVAVMGIGLEGGNLDHAERYAGWFREAGDEEAATILEQVCEEETGHVRFAARWFREFTGGLDFDEWRARLPEPLTPTIFKGRPLNREDRLRSGLDAEFLDRLAAW